VLAHSKNRGKGRALKTGIRYYLEHSPAESSGIVTADADGQHHANDIASVLETGRKRNGLVLGIRQFSRSVPFRSRFGNALTRFTFHAFVGRNLEDTQTGLRFIPRQLLPKLLRITYDRYEYELAMLIHAVKSGLPVIETPIRTIYIDNNASSHFKPVVDSLKVYSVFLRFSQIGLITAAIDYLVFWVAFTASQSILASMIMSRATAGSFNFVSSKRWVFRSSSPFPGELKKYVGLVAALLCVSWPFTEAVYRALGGHAVLAKMTVETALFLTSFFVQRAFVFRTRQQSSK
jgi:putative flippase GtrA